MDAVTWRASLNGSAEQPRLVSTFLPPGNYKFKWHKMSAVTPVGIWLGALFIFGISLNKCSGIKLRFIKSTLCRRPRPPQKRHFKVLQLLATCYNAVSGSQEFVWWRSLISCSEQSVQLANCLALPAHSPIGWILSRQLPEATCRVKSCKFEAVLFTECADMRTTFSFLSEKMREEGPKKVSFS